MRFHVVGFPHTQTTKAFSHCAYTQKVYNFCKMMRSLGHTVYHYGTEGSTPICTEHVTIFTLEEQRALLGEIPDGRVINVKFDPQEQYWAQTNNNAAREIQQRLQRGDFLCIIGGSAQQLIADLVGEEQCITVEYGIGYTGVFAKYRVFESYTHQSFVYGRSALDPDIRFYDAVIPNYYDMDDFPFNAEKSDNLLFLARVIGRKGIQIAVDTAREANMPLVIAGQGAWTMPDGTIYTEDGYQIPGGDNVYIGSVGYMQRGVLLGNARALIQPTIFLEPFGGSVVEAQLCGTPVITTDCAAFSETVRHGVTGYRCHTLEQFVWAAQHVDDLDPKTIRKIAKGNYSMERVKLMYEEYFTMLSGLWGEGWPTPNHCRSELNWLVKY
jgi:glycosyltransferase involved in cell wall biosynthesis